MLLEKPPKPFHMSKPYIFVNNIFENLKNLTLSE